MTVRIGIIDSGANPAHPHLGRLAGGVAIGSDDWTDRLGHGTAVAAAIFEKAPDADLFAVKVFDRRLATGIASIVAALDWCIDNAMDFVNFSVGATNPAHAAALRDAVGRATAAGIAIVAADGWLPGTLPGVVPVAVDWQCPREAYRTDRLPDGRTRYHASGYPRPIPGLPVEANLKGVSFAVANVTGLLAAARCRGQAV